MKMFSLSICCLLVGKHHRASLLSLIPCTLQIVSLYIHRLNIIASECSQRDRAEEEATK